MTSHQKSLADIIKRTARAYGSFRTQFTDAHKTINSELPEYMSTADTLAGWLKLVSYGSGIVTNLGQELLELESDPTRAASLVRAVDAYLLDDPSGLAALTPLDLALAQWLLAGLQAYAALRGEGKGQAIESSGQISIAVDGTAEVVMPPVEEGEPIDE